MVGLAVAGQLARCETLPHTIDPELLKRIWVLDENSASFLEENLERARLNGPREILEPLEYAAWAYKARKTIAAVRETLREMPLRSVIARRLRR
jgi:hypothetical protein